MTAEPATIATQEPELRLHPSDRTNLFGQETGRDHLSHSKIATLLNCAQRFGFHYDDRLELVDTPRPLGMGRAFAHAIEHQDPAAGAQLLRDNTHVRRQEDEDRLQVDETTVKAAAALYLERWPAPTNQLREFDYLVRLRNPWTGHFSRTFDLLGRADAVMNRGQFLALYEDKFVGQIDEKKIKRLKLDRQIALGCYGLWRATGLEVREVRYRFTRKPSIRQKKDETLPDFLERLAADYADPDRRDFYTHEEPLFRDADDLLRIEAELWVWAEKLRTARRGRLYDRNTSHCGDFGGCPFIPLCVGDPDAPALYRERDDHDRPLPEGEDA